MLFRSCKYLILCSAGAPSNKIVNSGRFNGEFRYLSVTCPKCFDLHQNIRFQFVASNYRIPNNLTLRLTNPQSSSYYATQHFQSPFLRKKAVGEIGPDSRHGRITINGTMSQFSCKLTVRSSFWDTKANKAAGKSLEAQRINRMSSSSAHLQV